MAPISAPTLRVLARPFAGGGELALEMNPDATILSLKRRIAEHWKLPLLCQSLAVGATVPRDGDSLCGLWPEGAAAPNCVTVIISTARLYEKVLSRDYIEREIAVEEIGVLAGRDYQRAMSALTAASRDPIKHVRITAIDALGKAAVPGEPCAIDALRACLEDRSREVRISAVEALGRALPWQHDGLAAYEAVAACLAPEAPRDVKKAMVEAIGDEAPRGSAPAVRALVSCLEDPLSCIRLAAAEALKKVGPLDSDADLQGKMLEATGMQVMLALAARSSDTDWEVRSTAMDALRRIATSLSDPSKWHAWQAVQAATAAQINALSSDPEPEVRRAAAAAAGSLGLIAAVASV